MTFEELIKTRRTTYEFNNKIIPPVDLRKILNAGRLSPSYLNTQPWKFLVIKNKNIIIKLMDTAIYGVFHSVPKTVVVPILTYDSYYNKKKKMACEKNRFWGLMSLSMASMNITLQASDLGIGNAIIGSEYAAINKILKIPMKNDIPFFIALGYEKEDGFQEIHKRKSFKEVISYKL